MCNDACFGRDRLGGGKGRGVRAACLQARELGGEEREATRAITQRLEMEG